MTDLILYTTEDGRSQFKPRAQEQPAWLTQLETVELIDATKQNRSVHLKNVFEDEELNHATTVKESLTVQVEGSRQMQRPVMLYNLDAIFLATAELRAKGKPETRMAFWTQNLDRIITSDGYPLFTRAGAVSHEQMEARTDALCRTFDHDRIKPDAIQAEQQDEANLRALETRIKRRPMT